MWYSQRPAIGVFGDPQSISRMPPILASAIYETGSSRGVLGSLKGVGGPGLPCESIFLAFLTTAPPCLTPQGLLGYGVYEPKDNA
jgi:hypothetical protein